VVLSGLKAESHEMNPVCGCKRQGFRVVDCTLCSIVDAALAGAGGVIWLKQVHSRIGKGFEREE
jgi:hypothetical protein